MSLAAEEVFGIAWAVKGRFCDQILLTTIIANIRITNLPPLSEPGIRSEMPCGFRAEVAEA